MSRKSKAVSKELKEVVDLDNFEIDHAPTNEGKKIKVIKIKKERKSKSKKLSVPVSLIQDDTLPLSIPKLQRSDAYKKSILESTTTPKPIKTKRESLWSATITEYGSIPSKSKSPDKYNELMMLYQKNKDKAYEKK